jgi:phosphate/sulfate permease
VRLREVEWLFWAAIVVAMCFDFTSGVHDASTAIASDVSTRALTTGQVTRIQAGATRQGALLVRFEPRPSHGGGPQRIQKVG